MFFYSTEMEEIKAIKLFLANSKLTPFMKQQILKKVYHIGPVLYRKNATRRKNAGWKDAQQIIQPRHSYITEIRISYVAWRVKLCVYFSDGNILQYTLWSTRSVLCHFNTEEFSFGLYESIIPVNEKCWINSFGEVSSESLSIAREGFRCHQINCDAMIE